MFVVYLYSFNIVQRVYIYAFNLIVLVRDYVIIFYVLLEFVRFTCLLNTRLCFLVGGNIVIYNFDSSVFILSQVNVNTRLFEDD